MGVYFVYRCPYNGPTEKYVKRFEDATVLEWFRRIWRPEEDVDGWGYQEEFFGKNVYGFGALFNWLDERKPPLPATIEQAVAALRATERIEVRYETHCVQLLTSDGEVQMAWYLFDDEYMKGDAGHAAYLLYEGEWLPQDAGAKAKGKGTIHAHLLMPWSDCYLQNLGPNTFAGWGGMRLPELCRHLLTVTTYASTGWAPWALAEALKSAQLTTDPEEQAFLVAIRENPAERVNWMAYTDWLMERGRPPASQHLLRLAMERMEPVAGRSRVGEHGAQVYLVGDGPNERGHWFLFDDVWASSHPELADSLLRFATRWDVLSTGNERGL